jgi:hypothetical protein
LDKIKRKKKKLNAKSAASCNLPHFGFQNGFQLKKTAVAKSAASFNLPHFGFPKSVSIQNKNAYNVVKMVLLQHLIINPFSL